jgi:hypothetical protein
MHSFSVTQLHLAAYIKANGATFTGCVDRAFHFTSDRPLADWRVAHSNSCCRRVDGELIELRKFLKETSPVEKS